MNGKILSLSLCFAVVLGAQGLSDKAHGASSSGSPAKLEHMDYFAARKIILGYGWVPVSGPCMQVEDDMCARFPEIQTCAYTFPGYCDMVFVRRDRCLYVTTSGGPPVEENGDTHVEDLMFRRGPCSKNQR